MTRRRDSYLINARRVSTIPEAEELGAAIAWLEKNDVDDEEGRACQAVARHLARVQKIRRRLA